MKYFKTFGISLLISILLIVILMFFVTMLNFFDILSLKTLSILKIGILLFCLFISSFYLGSKANKRGFLEGIKLCLVFVIFLIITNLILNETINIKDFIYYLLILISSIFGSMLGINTKK